VQDAGADESRTDAALAELLRIVQADPGQADALDQLRALLHHAPSRQVGQPGNDLIDTMVRQAFERAVVRNNDPTTWDAAKLVLARADEAQAALQRAIADKQLAYAQQGGLLVSPWYVRHTLESPGPLVLLLLMIGATMGAGFWFQRRGVLAIYGGASVAGALALALLALLVQTQAERANVTGRDGVRTSQQVVKAASAAARRALSADLDAARSLRGLWQCGRIAHPTAAFIPGQATLTFAQSARAPMRLHQLAPNLSEPGNLPEGRYGGPLVYIGKTLPDELAGKDLQGAVVLLEFNSDRRWVYAAQLGAAVVILIEPPAGHVATLSQAGQKITEAPLSIPRFYIQRRDLESALGVKWRIALEPGIDAVIDQSRPGRWVRREVWTDWLLIPGESGQGDSTAPAELVHLQTYKDAMSIVPALSPGATSASNLVSLLRLLCRFEANPPRRPVLISVVNDHTNALCGEQELFYTALADPEAIHEDLESIDHELARQQFLCDVYVKPPRHELIEQLRGWRLMIGGKMFEPKAAAIRELTRQRNALRGRSARLAVKQQDAGNDVRDIDTMLEDVVTLMKLFNRLGGRTELARLNDRQGERLSELFWALSHDAQTRVDQYRRDRRRLVENFRLRRRLLALQPESDLVQRGQGVQTLDEAEARARRYEPLPATTVLSLDQTFDTRRMGLFYTGHLAPNDVQDRIRATALARHALKVARNHEAATGRANLLDDTIRLTGGMPWEAHLGGRFAMAASAAQAYQVPALTLTGLRDMRLRAFTPSDTVDRIDAENFQSVCRFTEDFVVALVNSEGLSTTAPRGNAAEAQPVMAHPVLARRSNRDAISLPT
jgi:hypothetical protein